MKQAFPTRPVTKRLFDFRLVSFFLTTCALCALWACSPPPPENNAPSVSANATPVDVVDEPDVRDTAFMMKRLSSPASMAILYPSETVAYTSSHNTGELFDADVFQGSMEDEGKQWNIIFDEDGPGCIARVWLSGNIKGNLRIYFDGEEEPRIDAPIREFFSESYGEFTSLLVYGVKNSGGGNVCYMPMPYEKHCRIAIEADNKGAQYQVQAIHWDDEIPTKSFTPKFDEKTTQAKADMFRYLSSTADQHYEDLNKRTGSLTLEPNTKKLVASLTGPGAIQYLQFTANDYTMDVFMNLKITMYWDAQVEPAVNCTFAEFFNVADANQGWSIPAFGYLPNKKILVTQFYMPFHESAQIFIESTYPTPVTLNYEYRLALDDIADDAMYFYAQSVKTDGKVGYIYPAFQFDGKGRYVGCCVKTVSAQFGGEKHFYFEGDDYMYINGEPFATIQGTGLDNYFNAYNRMSSSVQFWGPTHGCRMKDDFEGGRTFCFRYHYLDSVPFQTSLLRIQELGCPVQMSASKETIDAPIHVEWVHYWYGIPSKKRVVHQEQLFRFSVSAKQDDAPTMESPLAIGDMLFIKMPPGDWWIHYAPIWDITQVQHVQKNVPKSE